MHTFSSERQPDRRLRTGEALLFFFFLLPLVLLGGTFLQTWRLREGTLITEWGFIFLPTMWYLKLSGRNIRRTLVVNVPGKRYLLAALILALSAVPLIAELSVLQDMIYPIPDDLIERLNRAFTLNEGESLSLSLFAFSITPAVCEEVLFRGILLRGLLEKLGSGRAIAISGVLFGLFHLNPYRFLPTALIGFIIAYLVISSSSLITGMLYHAVNNAFALAALNISFLRKYPWLFEEGHIPVPILIISLAAFVYGMSLLNRPGEQYSEFSSQRGSE